ncbi:MAG TPA: hypothetical protein VGW34_05395 [Allosphingosinicella sp.]|nr:hypothetical protein [Allosphingosinicella sp.]
MKHRRQPEPIDEADGAAEAQAAKCRLTESLERSRSLIADYRAKLVNASRPLAGPDRRLRGRPLFRFDI